MDREVIHIAALEGLLFHLRQVDAVRDAFLGAPFGLGEYMSGAREPDSRVSAAAKLLGLGEARSDFTAAAPIFDFISLSSDPEPTGLSYHLLPFEGDNPFVTKEPHGSMDVLVSGFCADVKKALALSKTAESLFPMCLRLMERYFWCVGAPGAVAGTTLYDAASLLSALAACGDSFCLLAADFSGIQRYIFGGAGAQKGAVKRLRARSFTVAAVMALVESAVLGAFDLPLSCTLMRSGGNAYILLPGGEETGRVCADLQRRVEAQVFDEYGGAFAVHLALTPFEPCEFERFNEVIHRASSALRLAKRRAFLSRLAPNGAWQVDAPLQMQGDRARGMCEGCGREFIDSTSDAFGCKCLNEQDLGRELTRAKRVSIVEGEGGKVRLCGQSLGFGGANGTAFALNSRDEGTRLHPVLRMVNYIPHENGQPLTFEQLANKARGNKRVAVLKADVDRLGAAFAAGLMSDGCGVHVSQLCALSRALDYFFGEWMGELIEGKFQNCYTVFSGGDDMVFIGPWDEIVELALETQRCFRQYCGGRLTLSAAIELFGGKTPVRIAIDAAEHGLDSAKNVGDMKGSSGRNQLRIFGRSMEWARAREVFKTARRIARLYGDGQLTSGDVYKMRRWALMFQEYYRHGNPLGLRYSAFIAYDMGRKQDDRRSRENLDEYRDLWNRLKNDISENAEIHYLQVACDWAININRRSDGR